MDHADHCELQYDRELGECTCYVAAHRELTEARERIATLEVERAFARAAADAHREECDAARKGWMAADHRSAMLARALRPFALCVGDDGVVRGVALHDDYLAAREALA